MPGGQQTSLGQGSASPGITIALVGIALATAAGTLTPSNEDIVALTGQAITTAQGTVSAVRGKPLLTLSQGTPVVSASVPLTGSAITSAQGLATPNSDGTVPLVGEASSVQAGVVAPSWGQALTGIESTPAIGSVGVNLRPTDIEGQVITTGQGVTSPSGNDLDVNLSGEEAVFAQGSVAVGPTLLGGEVSTSGTGTAAPSSDVALTGSSCTAAAGTVGTGQDADDTLITSSSGAVGNARDVALTGSEAVSEQGDVAITGDVEQPLTGEEVAFEQGSTASDWGPTLTGQEITGAQYNVGAPGFAELTGAEIVSTAGTIFVTEDREQALVGASATFAQGTAAPGISPILTGQLQPLAQGPLLPPNDGIAALIGLSMFSEQGDLGLIEHGPVSVSFREDQADQLPQPEPIDLEALIRADDELIVIVAAALLEAA